MNVEAGVTRITTRQHSHRGTIKLAEGEVLELVQHAGGQTVMRIQCPAIASIAKPGSFVHLKCSPDLPLRRPMSIMRSNPRQGWFDMLFKTHGAGTRQLSRRRVGESLSILGPIGRGFRLGSYRPRALLIGGGVGIPPMVFLAEHMRQSDKSLKPLVLMGSEVPFPFAARPSQIMLNEVPEEVIAAMPLLDDWGIASRLASLQAYPGCYEGYVTDLAREVLERAGEARDDYEIFACGPTPMLRAVQQLAQDFAMPCEISLEEYMACAVGGCAGCTVRVNTPAGQAMKRVCVDGPVFEAASVVFGS